MRHWLLKLKLVICRHVYSMDISPTARISVGALLDKANPRGVHIGDESYIASGARIITHDSARGVRADTYVGKRSFVGFEAIVNCGVRIGDHVVIENGAVVSEDVPDGCRVAGNPASIVQTGIWTGAYGRIP